MRSQFSGKLSVLAAALALGGCASTGSSVTSARPAVNARTATVATASRDTTPGKPKTVTHGGFRKVVRNGKELYCQRALITGSRTNVQETCMTEQELLVEESRRDEFTRRVQGSMDPRTGADRNNSVTNSVASPR